MHPTARRGARQRYPLNLLGFLLFRTSKDMRSLIYITIVRYSRWPAASHRGDTVNTAARIEAQCRPLDRQILVSETLLEQCQVPDDLQVEDMGEQPLRGKEHAVRLYSVTART